MVVCGADLRETVQCEVDVTWRLPGQLRSVQGHVHLKGARAGARALVNDDVMVIRREREIVERVNGRSCWSGRGPPLRAPAPRHVATTDPSEGAGMPLQHNGDVTLRVAEGHAVVSVSTFNGEFINRPIP